MFFLGVVVFYGLGLIFWLRGRIKDGRIDEWTDDWMRVVGVKQT